VATNTINDPTLQKRLEAQERFLAAFARIGVIRHAAKAAKVDRSTVYDWQEHDAAFSVRFGQARAESDDRIREEIHRRAALGLLKPVYQGGKLVGTIREFSDTLLIFLAKARMPEFREQSKIEHSGELTLSLKSLAEIKHRAGN